MLKANLNLYRRLIKFDGFESGHIFNPRRKKGCYIMFNLSVYLCVCLWHLSTKTDERNSIHYRIFIVCYKDSSEISTRLHINISWMNSIFY